MFGEILDKILKDKKMRGKDLAILADITEGYVSDLRRGRAIPRKEKLLSILDALNLKEETKKELYEAWERESAPLSFVKKYDELKLQYDNLKNILETTELNLDLIEQLKNQKKIVEKLEKQKERYKLYKELFNMLKKEDRDYILKTILRNIEYDMREEGIYSENKKELDKIKELISQGVDYDF